mgnify:CR=1 FL=1
MPKRIEYGWTRNGYGPLSNKGGGVRGLCRNQFGLFGHAFFRYSNLNLNLIPRSAHGLNDAVS